MFRAAQGLGGLMSPLLAAWMFSLGEYQAVFLFVGVGYLILSPLVNIRIRKARHDFNLMKLQQKKEEEELENMLGKDQGEII